MNLALSDLFMLTSNCPLNFVSGLYGRWVFGEIGCDIYGFSGCVFGLTSINTIALISIDRLYSVMMSLQRKKISYVLTTSYISAVWVYCIIWSALPFFGINEYALEGFLTTCTVNYTSQKRVSKIYNLCLFLFCFILPLLIIAGTYTKIFHILSKHQADMKSQIKNLTSSEGKLLTKNFNKTVKMAKIALYLLTGYLIAWGPYSIVYILSAIGYGENITPFMSMLPAILAKTSGIYNPIIYVASHEKFKEILKKKYKIFRTVLESFKEEERKRKVVRADTDVTNETSYSQNDPEIGSLNINPAISYIATPDISKTKTVDNSESNPKNVDKSPKKVLQEQPTSDFHIKEAQIKIVVAEVNETLNKNLEKNIMVMSNINTDSNISNLTPIPTRSSEVTEL
ncbi:unnamed protein product [Gordionus sp. m RMFG-2023]